VPDTRKIGSNFRIQGILLILAFIFALIILGTDKNLQTDFGIAKPYFIHWYGMLAVAIVSLIGGVILVASPKRSLGIAGTIGSGLLVLFLIADIATYSTLGAGLTASQFATYLFGVSKYPGSLSYIPGMYDVLFVTVLAAFIAGLVILKKREKTTDNQFQKTS
jgi:hypothetical protein